jgi:diguanylate cyclase (GGDEF)-like protein
MTGLYNSRYFEQMLFDYFNDAVASDTPLTIAILDIDHFKKLNDLNGHAAGDEMLRQVGRLIAEATAGHQDAMAFRYGGEEFCILFPNTRPAQAMEVVDHLRVRISELNVTHMETQLTATASIGLATSTLDASDCKELFERADTALYACKHNGRNHVRHYAGGAKIPYHANEMERSIDEAYRALNPL